MADKQMVDFLCDEIDEVLAVRSITKVEFSEILKRLYAEFPGRSPLQYKLAVMEAGERTAQPSAAGQKETD